MKAEKQAPEKSPRQVITDKPVMEATGHGLEHWYHLLDVKKAASMKMDAIYKLVNELEGLQKLSEWNRGLLATSYGWSRGVRERGEKANGFEVGVSKTIAVPIHALFLAWTEETKRKKWLSEKIEIRKSTADKSLRVTWVDGASSVSVEFYPKAADKSQVVVQHLKLTNAEHADKMKLFWAEKLGQLKTLLEK